MKGSAKANRGDCRLWRPTTLADDWASERFEKETGRDRCHGRKLAYATESGKETEMSGYQELKRSSSRGERGEGLASPLKRTS